MPTQIADGDIEALRGAINLLEYPSLDARTANLAGKPIELIGHALPAGSSRAISLATTKALEAALKVAVLTTQKQTGKRSIALNRVWRWLLVPLAVPFGFAVMLRSIVDIARSEKEDLTDPESALSCIQVSHLAVVLPPPTLPNVAILQCVDYLPNR